jgi:FkbM family methyltransferase
VILDKTYSKHLTLEKSDVFLDIGGQIGTFSIDIADKVKQVYTFEPFKENYDLLESNIALNKTKNVCAFNKAVVGNDDQERTLYAGGKFNGLGANTGGFSLIDTESEEKVVVQCANINAIIKKFGITKIKMDCEGSEYEIIKNADFLGIKELILEYHFNLLGMAKYEELLNILADNFQVHKEKFICPTGQTIIHCKKLEPPKEVAEGK